MTTLALNQNSIPFANASGLLTENSNELVWDNANSRAGIGTATPNAKLTVEGVVSLLETTSPGDDTGYGKVFVKSSDSLLYFRDDGGTEYNLTGGSSSETWVSKSANYTAVAGDNILADTSGGAFTITLPASASRGDKIQFIDSTSSFATNNLTIGRNALNIMGLAEDMTVSTDNVSFGLVYDNAANGWRIF
ncbi:MAG: hypothetical protein CMI57_01415 [Parcubacteria group bacterium]|jgi:hypothetical protein|nr:hypothetical protein [Parcubacteria group bacterium]HJP17676.1 hypothetical protein [Nitrospinota bacterium]|tara:strand:- start:945 stop:1520 length:576 start_codon:yes stop_codon:yes gene_type:complete